MPRAKKNIPIWTEYKGDTCVIKFNLFNDDPMNLNSAILQNIINALMADSQQNFSTEWGYTWDIKLFHSDDKSNSKLMDGTRIPILCGIYNNAGFYHGVSTSGVYDGNDNLIAGTNALPDGTPFIILSTDNVTNMYTLPNNPYGISPTTVPINTYMQCVSTILSHELREISINDGIVDFVCIYWAPFIENTIAENVNNWNFGFFDESGVAQNGTIGSDGYVRLWPFKDIFPTGGIFFTSKECGDPVDRGMASLYDSYEINGWKMCNYVLPTFYQSYSNNNRLVNYDKLCHVTSPMQPHAGLFEYMFFLSYDLGWTFVFSVNNWGPVTYSMRGEPIENNFPPNYNIVTILGIYWGCGLNQNSMNFSQQQMVNPDLLKKVLKSKDSVTVNKIIDSMYTRTNNSQNQPVTQRTAFQNYIQKNKLKKTNYPTKDMSTLLRAPTKKIYKH
jgi:hypothetical protein